MHVLFVCTGNICRSPTAERLVTRLQVPGLRASSAGIRAVIGHPMHDDAARVLESMRGDASNFVARQLTSKIALDADLIVTMTTAHRTSVLELAPRQLHRTFTLSEAALLATRAEATTIADLAALRSQLAAHDVSDIPDPIGRDAEVFVAVGSQIADLLAPVLDLVRRQEPPG